MTALSPQLSPVQSRTHYAEYAEERPRAVTAMSYASTHSKKSSKSESRKLDLTETTQEKRRLQGKADPTKALHELQPAAVALEEGSLADIRGMQHKDQEGNLIVDPDRSNPTRPRLERPLDTIRSFNDAADGTANRRVSSQRPSPGSPWDNQSRRNSSHFGPPNGMYSPHGRGPPPSQRPGYGGYYRHNSYGFRADSYAEDTASQVSGAPPPPRHQHQRWQSNPYIPHAESPSSFHSQQHSYETMTSGSDENSKSTNPSSQNSSFDRLHQTAMMGKRPQEDYGINFHHQDQMAQLQGPPPGPSNRPAHPAEIMRHYGPPPQQNQYYQQNQNQYQPVRHPQQMPMQQRGPPPPPKNIISLTSSGPVDDYGMTPSSRQDTKRKSWIKRTFSRRGS